MGCPGGFGRAGAVSVYIITADSAKINKYLLHYLKRCELNNAVLL